MKCGSYYRSTTGVVSEADHAACDFNSRKLIGRPAMVFLMAALSPKFLQISQLLPRSFLE